MAIVVLTGLSSFADMSKDNDEFTKILLDRVQECQNHFDIEPFFLLVSGSYRGEKLSPEVIAALHDFPKTGRLILPSDKKNDLVALSCANYAEGLIASRIVYQLTTPKSSNKATPYK